MERAAHIRKVTPNDDEKLVETFVLPVAILIATGYSANGASDELAKGKRVCDLLAEAQCASDRAC